MASITVRNLDETTKQALRERAAKNGRSMEEEARLLLSAVTTRNSVQTLPDNHNPSVSMSAIKVGANPETVSERIGEFSGFLPQESGFC